MLNVFRKARIYLDYASAPPVLPEAMRAMHEAETLVGNPGAIHAEGVAAKKSLENSRAGITLLLGCKAREIIFTSGLTEANNLAIVGLARQLQILGRLKKSHWVVSAIEHDAVLQSFAEVERVGGTITHVEPDKRGVISPRTIAHALRPETVLVSVGWANSEIGVVQPLRQISRTVRAKNPTALLHSDAGQAPLYLASQVHTLGVDLLALGGNKLYGPHGVGALYISNRAELAPISFGGGQERALRAGTENVALAAGFAAAFEVVARERARESRRLRTLRDELARGLVARIPGLVENGDLRHALPHMLNVSVPNIQSEYVTLALDHAGIAVSTKSACREGGESRSHVVACIAEAAAKAGSLGGEHWRAENTLRFSLGRDTTSDDIRRVSIRLQEVAESFRA